jgi:DNA-directed RNA polymerase subunit RPC12/RpoP
MGTCPECEENFDLDEDAQIGDVIECPRCKTRLELLSLHPAMVDFAT